MSSLSKSIVQGITHFLLERWFPAIYRRAARRPVDSSKIVFFETQQLEMPNSFSLMYERLNNDDRYDVNYISCAQSEASGFYFYRECVRFVKSCATASVIFLRISSSLVGCLPIREETRVVQLWHGCGAFKRFGMSIAEKEVGLSRDEFLRNSPFANTDLVTVSSPEVVWAYSEAMMLPENVIKPLGVSRTDVFFDQRNVAEAKQRLLLRIPEIARKSVILYAPTFRGNTGVAEAPNALNLYYMKEELADKYVILVKQHQSVKHIPQIPETCKGFAFDVTGDIPINDLLMAADICIADYSSLVFEWSLMLKPILFFAYDYDSYLDERGFYYPYEEFVPGPICRTTLEIVERIKGIGPDFDASRLVSFRQRFMSACDGHATERICRYLFDADKGQP